MSWIQASGLALATLVFISGCASSQQKQRREQQAKVISSSKLYCEFLNGEQYPDIDVALNLAIAQKCDSDKTLSITSYKTPSEIPGIMFCCAVSARAAGMSAAKPRAVETAKKADSKADAAAAAAPEAKAAGEESKPDGE